MNVDDTSGYGTLTYSYAVDVGPTTETVAVQFAAAPEAALIVKLDTGNEPIPNETQPEGDELNVNEPETAGVTETVVPEVREITSGACAELVGERTKAALATAVAVAVALDVGLADAAVVAVATAVAVDVAAGEGEDPPPLLHAVIANTIKKGHTHWTRTTTPILINCERKRCSYTYIAK